MTTTRVRYQVVFSIVSHGQLDLISYLLGDIRKKIGTQYPIVLVVNIPEDEAYLKDFSDLSITVVRNKSPRGFGENHNLAFEVFESEYFVIFNPDIRISSFSMEIFVNAFDVPRVGVVAPAVFSSLGFLEDSIRHFPTVKKLLIRQLIGKRMPDYTLSKTPLEVDWAAGMLLAFRSEVFKKIGGFNEKYYMYMEDVDICRRIKTAGFQVIANPSLVVIHDAQRASHTSFKYLVWHLKSVLRYFFFKK